MGATGAFSTVLNDLTNLPQAVTDAQEARDAALAAKTAAEDAATAAAASNPGAPNGTAQLDGDSKLKEEQVPDRLSESGLLASTGDIATQFSSVVTKVIDDDGYTAWPNANTFLDEGSGYIVEIYTTGLSHAADGGAAQKRVLCRRRAIGAAASDIEAAVTVSDLRGINKDSEVNAAGLAPNGDWCALIRTSSNSTWGQPDTYRLYRSSDLGQTWDSGADFRNSFTPANLLPVHLGGWFTSAAGTTMTLYKSYFSNACYVARTTQHDAGMPWDNYGTGGLDQPIANLPVGALEGSFVQTNDGTIICLFRKTIDANYSDPQPAMMTLSSDDGLTWTPGVDTDIVMTNNNVSMLHDPYTDTIELFVGDRLAQSDGKGSIWQYVVTAAQAKAGQFGAPYARLVVGTSSRDFGYPEAMRLRDGRTVLRYYDRPAGVEHTAAIYERHGVRVVPVAPAVTLAGDQQIEGAKTFVASPTAPTPTQVDRSDKVATTAFVAAARIGEVLVRDGVTPPLTFSDLVTNEAGTDLLHGN